MIGSSAVIESPDEHRSKIVEAMETNRPPTNIEAVELILGKICDSLGPAILAYGALPRTHAPQYETTAPLPLSEDRVQAFLNRLPATERQESDIDETDSGATLALDPNRQPMSAGGYRRWPCSIAHVGVVTGPDARRQGYGLAAGSATIELARSQGLLSQWRAAESNSASIALAERLGLDLMGYQFSFMIR